MNHKKLYLLAWQGTTWFIIVSLVILLGKHIWLNIADRYPITNVELLGQTEHLETSELKLQLADLLQHNFWQLDVGAVQSRLKILPWVSEVTVRKTWPNTLTLEFIEHIPLAIWNDQGIVATTGKAMYPNSSLEGLNLPRFYAAEEMASETLDVYITLLEELAPIGLSITRLASTPEQGWRVTLDNNKEIILGNSDLTEQIRRFSVVYKKKLQHMISNIAYIDLRYTNGVAIGYANKNAKSMEVK